MTLAKNLTITFTGLFNQPTEHIGADGNPYKVITFKAKVDGTDTLVRFTLSKNNKNRDNLLKIAKEHLNKPIEVSGNDLIKREYEDKNGDLRYSYDLKKPIANLRKLDDKLFQSFLEKVETEW